MSPTPLSEEPLPKLDLNKMTASAVSVIFLMH